MPADGDLDDSPGAAGREPDYRFTLANERTFLAWIRTSLALIAGGVALVQLVPRFGVHGVRHLLSMVLVVGGAALAVLAVCRWQHVQQAMRRGAALPPSRLPTTVVVATVLIAVLLVVLLITSPPPTG